jgi:DNA polymerase-3 subunit alpha
MLYQEQVQHAARALAGFSLGQGDILRRAMGKKKPEEMAAQRDKFVKGCLETNKIPKAQAEKIFDNIEHFAGYGFNKSHSAAYGIIAYQTAYLKAHYPVEFMAALLSIEMANSDKLIVFISEAQEMEIDVLPPDVNLSSVRFRPIEKTIRFGMAGVKNVGTAAVESIVAEREANGPYKDLVDFCSRIDGSMVNRKVIESLVKCGAFDFTGMSRGRVFNGVDFAMSRAASAQRDRQQGQTTLFGMMAGGDDAKSGDNELPDAPPWSNREMLAHEKALLGFYISGHPLKEHEWALKHFSLARPEGVSELGSGAETRTGGLISQYRKTITKKSQRPMGIFRLEGLEGSVNVIVFPDTFEEYGSLLEEEKPVMVCGEVDVRDQEAQIKASEIYPLEDAHKLFCKHVSIHVSAIHTAEKDLEKIRDVIRRHPGSVQAVICLQFPSGEKVFVDTGNSFEVNPSAALEHELDHVLGEGSVFVEKDPKACRMDHSKGRRNNWRKAG